MRGLQQKKGIQVSERFTTPLDSTLPQHNCTHFDRRPVPRRRRRGGAPCRRRRGGASVRALTQASSAFRRGDLALSSGGDLGLLRLVVDEGPALQLPCQASSAFSSFSCGGTTTTVLSRRCACLKTPCWRTLSAAAATSAAANDQRAPPLLKVRVGAAQTRNHAIPSL